MGLFTDYRCGSNASFRLTSGNDESNLDRVPTDILQHGGVDWTKPRKSLEPQVSVHIRRLPNFFISIT